MSLAAQRACRILTGQDPAPFLERPSDVLTTELEAINRSVVEASTRLSTLVDTYPQALENTGDAGKIWGANKVFQNLRDNAEVLADAVNEAAAIFDQPMQMVRGGP